MTSATDAVRRYYERHTRAFVAFGEGGALGALHRAIAAPGVCTRAEAFRYVENQIIQHLQRDAAGRVPQHVVDLGCGVGGSLCYIAARMPVVGTGITLSETQAALGRQRITRAGLTGRVTIVAGDYAAVPAHVPEADVAFAIESFVHSADPAAFFAECRRLVRPGGVLVLCDDFIRAVDSEEGRTAVARFRRGWHINTLLSSTDLRSLATAAGFVHESTTDLSPYVELGRPRDRLVDVVAPALERLPWRWSRLDPWLGGSALQASLRKGWIAYELVVFRAAAA